MTPQNASHTSTPLPADPGYRPDIDGLRALAVLAVALHHGDLGPFAGGYVGVDIFFVISGYLITKIVAREQAAGSFSLLRFYERRVRRIAPALVVVIAAVVLFTLLFKAPREANLFGESVTFVAMMASNFFFYDEIGYFGAAAEDFALLHTWSLSVEEQFYLFFPPLLVWQLARRASWLGGTLIALTALSFAASILMVKLDASAAFYLTPFRIWELLLGALLALGFAPELRSRLARELCAGFGFILAMSAILLFDPQTAFPGLAALPPTLGAAMIIHAGAGGSSIVGRMLSWRPVVFIGLCSYSFYLWHWPALGFARYLQFEPLSHLQAAAVLAGAFALSVISLYAVERPFRRAPSTSAPARSIAFSRRRVFQIAAASFVGAIAVGLFLQASKGWPERFPGLSPLFAKDVNHYGLEISQCVDARSLLPATKGGTIHQTFCRFGPSDAPADLLIWGDSHALALWPAFRDVAAAQGRAGYLAVMAECPPYVERGRPLKGAIGVYPNKCREHNIAVDAGILKLHIRQVVLVSAGFGFYGQISASDAWRRRQAAAMIASIRERGVDALATTPVPTYPMRIPTAMFRSRSAGISLPEPPSRAKHVSRYAQTAAALERSGGRLIRVEDALCAQERCRFQTDGVPLYSDNNHLNIHGAREIAPLAAKALAGRPARHPTASAQSRDEHGGVDRDGSVN